MSSAAHSGTVIKYETHREAVRFTLEWTIANFKTFQNDIGTIKGAGITMAELGIDDYEARLFVSVIPCYDNEQANNEKKFLAVFLDISDTDEETMFTEETEVPVEFSGRITTGKTSQEEIWSAEDTDVFMFSAAKDVWGWPNAISHDELFGSDEQASVLIDDCITVFLYVTVYREPQRMQIPQMVVSNTAEHHQKFITRQLNWFDSQRHRIRKCRDLDFVLQSSDGKEFHTSRWILMAHSPVFAAMLKHNSKETKTSRCEMADVDGETTNIMLNYVYGCCVKEINKDNAEKVLIMADKYQMMDLRDACEELLANSVTVGTAVHLLVVASQRGLEKLKIAALDVIPKNMTTVLKDRALEEALQADPYLMQTIMEHCSKKMRVTDEA